MQQFVPRFRAWYARFFRSSARTCVRNPDCVRPRGVASAPSAPATTAGGRSGAAREGGGQVEGAAGSGHPAAAPGERQQQQQQRTGALPSASGRRPGLRVGGGVCCTPWPGGGHAPGSARRGRPPPPPARPPCRRPGRRGHLGRLLKVKSFFAKIRVRFSCDGWQRGVRPGGGRGPGGLREGPSAACGPEGAREAPHAPPRYQRAPPHDARSGRPSPGGATSCKR